MKKTKIELEVIDYNESVLEELVELTAAMNAAIRPGKHLSDEDVLSSIHIIMELCDVMGYAVIADDDDNYSQMPDICKIQPILDDHRSTIVAKLPAYLRNELINLGYHAWSVKQHSRGRRAISFPRGGKWIKHFGLPGVLSAHIVEGLSKASENFLKNGLSN